MECNYTAVKIVHFVYLWMVHTAYGQIMANHSEARVHCKTNGGLASHEYFIGNNGHLLHIEALDIRDGDSAWINGYVNFSTFVSWMGCYSEKRNINDILKKYLAKNSIYTCSNYCINSNNNVTNIGIHGNMCICLSYSELHLDNNWHPSPNEQCGLKRHVPSDLTYGGNPQHEAINVYLIHRQSSLFWSPAIPKLQQCVYASNVHDKPKYATESCFAGSENGFICRNSVYGTLNNTCELYHTVSRTCFVSESSNWIDARNRCYDYTGKLVSHIYSDIRQHAIRNKKYWTGIFRGFDIMGNASPNYACLAVTRFQNELVLDADNCAVEKQIMCKDDISVIQVTITTNYAVTERNSENMEELFVYIGIGVGVVAITALIIIMCVFLRRKIKYSQNTSEAKQENRDNSTTDTRAIASDSIDKRRDASQNNLNVLLEQNYESAYYTTPDAKYFLNSSNESVYDRMNLKKPDNGANLNNMDHSVYNHTIGIGETDTYDELVGNTSEQLATLSDSTYNKVGDVSDDYHRLGFNKVAISANVSDYALSTKHTITT